MKKNFTIIYAVLAAMLLAAGCNTERIMYDGPAYVGFPDTLGICPVTEDGSEYRLAVASTVKCDYDRTYGVEVIPSKSNAIYGRHYELSGQSVTIKAGETSAYISVKGNYEAVSADDSLAFTLRLALMNPEEEWEHYGLETRVQLKKICPFDLKSLINWSEHTDGGYGYCVVTSSFRKRYDVAGVYQRLCKTSIEDEAACIIRVHDIYYDGYDILVRLDNSDPMNPRIKMTEEQIIADTRECFNTIHGNGEVLAYDTQGAPNTFDPCHQYALQYVDLRVDGVGIVGTFYHLIEWITDEQAKDFK